MPSVRTTVTLDDDLAARLRDRAHERGVPFKTVINEALRHGLDRTAGPSERYVLRGRRMGVPKVDVTKALQLSGQMEDAELARRMSRER